MHCLIFPCASSTLQSLVQMARNLSRKRYPKYPEPAKVVIPAVGLPNCHCHGPQSSRSWRNWATAFATSWSLAVGPKRAGPLGLGHGAWAVEKGENHRKSQWFFIAGGYHRSMIRCIYDIYPAQVCVSERGITRNHCNKWDGKPQVCEFPKSRNCSVVGFLFCVLS